MVKVKFRAWFLRLGFFLGLALLLEASGIAASVNPSTVTPHKKTRNLTENQHARRRMRTLARSRAPRSTYAGTRSAATRYNGKSYTGTPRRHRYYERFHTSSFASDITEDKVSYYAHQFGLGELARYRIPGEQLGAYPEEEISPKLGGVGKMCSFGEGISMTPLQLGALVTAISNGGTLYYLQHPTSPDAVASFQPRVKRHLDIEPVIPELSDGMAGAVAYGTARSVRLNFNEESILGKTGTCSRAGTRYGWFASYANADVGPMVTVAFLQGGRPTFVPKAAPIAGRTYRNLYDHNFFVAGSPQNRSSPTPREGTRT